MNWISHMYDEYDNDTIKQHVNSIPLNGQRDITLAVNYCSVLIALKATMIEGLFSPVTFQKQNVDTKVVVQLWCWCPISYQCYHTDVAWSICSQTFEQ